MRWCTEAVSNAITIESSIFLNKDKNRFSLQNLTKNTSKTFDNREHNRQNLLISSLKIIGNIIGNWCNSLDGGTLNQESWLRTLGLPLGTDYFTSGLCSSLKLIVLLYPLLEVLLASRRLNVLDADMKSLCNDSVANLMITHYRNVKNRQLLPYSIKRISTLKHKQTLYLLKNKN